MPNQAPNLQPESEFVYTISKEEIQAFAEHFRQRELTSTEMDYFIHRFDKHLSCETVVDAFEDCLADILESSLGNFDKSPPSASAKP